MKTLRVLNLGGGVQSSVMALMADKGLFGDIPDVAIYADTQSDPPAVAAMVEWLTDTIESFPVETVTAGNLEEALLRGKDNYGSTFVSIPIFTVDPFGRKGQGRRSCTNEYKIRPIKRRIRQILGLQYRQRVPADQTVEQWMGISLDEAWRMKPAKDKWGVNRYPLIDAEMTRHNCLQWWKSNAPEDAPPIGRSACFFCPYKSSREWSELSDDLVARAVSVETSINHHDKSDFNNFLHRRGIPIQEALAADAADVRSQPSLFDAECEGYCGV